MRILGIDPGFGRIGFGCIELQGTEWEAIDFGVITTDSTEDFPDRLIQIYDDMNTLIKEFSPDIAAIEELFFAQNVTTGMQVAEARGVITLSLAQHSLPIYSYAPNEIKAMICGYGRADKKQVQHMIVELLNLSRIPQPDDAADALAIALTCGLNRVHL
ncbi:crossover junction endodeoxyribonuclease RuvC [Candidatus Peregrinibacteria bacterium]|nr:MAG: crossover junction endodeoxyribonuclease RuvC [Candidatus Peregrinibacteria bacterium]